MATGRSVQQRRRFAARALCIAWLLASSCAVAAAAQSTDQPPRPDAGTQTEKARSWRWPERIHVVTEAAQAPPSRQVAIDESIISLFPDSSRVTLGLMLVPDPRVPRHRRAFDIATGALSSGMLDAKYVLDRFTLPWSPASGDDSEQVAQLADDGRFGLMIFRHDCWRELIPDCRGAMRRIVAMYLVPETVSYGVPTRTLQRALACMMAQVPDSQRKPQWRGSNAPCREESPDDKRPKIVPDPNVDLLRSDLTGCSRMVLLGPDFSGSIDSIARVLASALDRGQGDSGICLISVSATAKLNQQIESYRGRDGLPLDLKYYPLTVSDEIKFSALLELTKALGIQPAPGTERFPLALLCEESVFGSGLCHDIDVQKKSMLQMRFPSNIADIRFHRSEAERKAASDAPIDVSALESGLHLDQGAENGSEFPDSQQSPLTAAGSELKLDKMLQILGHREPQIIAVAATDVRDRLFLFEQLRAEVPDAVLVDLEADVLLAHPDFLHASRGILMLASHQLYDDRGEAEGKAALAKPLRSYATDYEALAIKAVSRLVSGQNPLVGDATYGESDAAPDLRWPCTFIAARGGPRRAYIWGHTASVDGVCIAKPAGKDPDGLAWRERYGGGLAVLFTVLVILWLARRREAWVTNDWSVRSALAEFGMLPAVAIALVLVGTPGTVRPVQWVLNVLVLCALLSPLLALHRSAIRVFETDSTRERRWLLDSRKLVGSFRALPLTMKVIAGIPFGIGITFLLLAPLAWIAGSVFVPWGSAQHWLRLASDTSSGFGLLPALGIAYVAVLFGLACTIVGMCRYCRNDRVMDGVNTRLGHGAFRREVGKSVLLVLYAALAYATAKSLPPAHTIFGRAASAATLVAEIALCAQAIMFVLWALTAVRRTDTFAKTLYWSLAKAKKRARAAERIWSDFWSSWSKGPVFLSKTPFSASLQPIVDTERALPPPDRSLLFCDTSQQAGQIVEWIRSDSTPRPEFGVWAIYRLLVSEVSALRWSAFGALFSCLALVVVVYEFPAPGADNFLLLGLGLMLLAGMITAYSVITLERSKWISRVLCNTSERVEFSWSYFAYLLSPVLLLSLAIAIVQEPGVLVWGNGLMSMLRYVGLLR